MKKQPAPVLGSREVKPQPSHSRTSPSFNFCNRFFLVFFLFLNDGKCDSHTDLYSPIVFIGLGSFYNFLYDCVSFAKPTRITGLLRQNFPDGKLEFVFSFGFAWCFDFLGFQSLFNIQLRREELFNKPQILSRTRREEPIEFRSDFP